METKTFLSDAQLSEHIQQQRKKLTTGYVLALAGMLTAKFDNDIQVKGDFTKATAEDMEVRVQGKIVLGKLVWAVLAFALTKPVRKAILKMIKFLRKKDKA